MDKDRTYIVMAIEHYNPLGVIRSLGEAGINPVFIAVSGRVPVASASRYIKQVHYADSVEAGYKILISQYGAEKGSKPIVFCSDDKTMGYLDARYEELKDRFIFFNAGAGGRITKYMDKKQILLLAEKYGLNVLNTVVVKRGDIPDGLEFPVITKSISPNAGGWKADVNICRNKIELEEAYKNIKSSDVLVQKYIEKKNEYCLDGFSIHKGQQMFHAIASTYNYLIPGYYSPYMTVSRPMERFKKPLEGMMAEIGFEGIYSIEFLIDSDDNYWFSEINFRNSTWSYASTQAGMALPVLWAEATLRGEIDTSAYKNIRNGFTAMVEPVDYSKRVKTGRISQADWLIDFKAADCGFYYSKEDPEPFRLAVENWEKLG